MSDDWRSVDEAVEEQGLQLLPLQLLSDCQSVQTNQQINLI